MRLQSLIHLVTIGAAVAPDRRIFVFGSASLLGSFPNLANNGGPLETSNHADLLIEGVDDELAGVLEQSIGRKSRFEAMSGYCAGVMRADITETFPRGWEQRLNPLPGCEIAQCLDPYDLAAVKVQSGRPKDVELCANLVRRGHLQATLIQDRLRETQMSDHLRALTSERLQWVFEIAGQPSP